MFQITNGWNHVYKRLAPSTRLKHHTRSLQHRRLGNLLMFQAFLCWEHMIRRYVIKNSSDPWIEWIRNVSVGFFSEPDGCGCTRIMRNRDPACSFTVSPPWSWHFFLVWLLLCNFHSPSVEDRYIFSMVGTESGWTCRFKSNKSMDSKQASKNKSEHCRHLILQEHVGAHRCNYLIILFTSIFHHFFWFSYFLSICQQFL